MLPGLCDSNRRACRSPRPTAWRRRGRLVVRPDPVGQPDLVAYIVVCGDLAPDAGQLRRHLWSRLPGYIWPAAVVVVDTLPRRQTGASTRSAGGRRRLSAQRKPGQPPLPEAALLASLWARALGREQIGMAKGYWLSFPCSWPWPWPRLAKPDWLLLACRSQDRTSEILATAVVADAPMGSRLCPCEPW